MRPAHLPGVVAVAVTALVTALGLLLAPGALASAAAPQSPAVQAAAQALRPRAGVPHNNNIRCSDNLPVGNYAVAAVCIGEEEPFTFRVAAAIKNNYGYNIYAAIGLYFSPGHQFLGKCVHDGLNPGRIFTCTSRRAFHTYPVAGEARIIWAGGRANFGDRTIDSPEFTL